MPEINIFIVLKTSELQNKQVTADILLGFYLGNEHKGKIKEKLTTQRPYKAFHLSCMSPAVQQYEDASACDKYWLLSSDLWKIR